MNLKIGFSNPANKLDGILRKITLNPSQDEHCHLKTLIVHEHGGRFHYLELNFFQKMFVVLVFH
jgi:hypothetical protein